MFTKTALPLFLLPRPRPLRPLNLTLTLRPISTTSPLLFPRKDSQDKDSINREPTEYSKSGTDDQAAAMDEAAFDPAKTAPEEEMERAGEESGNNSNPLEVSPANAEVSKPRGATEGGAENSSSSSGTTSGRQRSSGGGSPKKGSKVA